MRNTSATGHVSVIRNYRPGAAQKRREAAIKRTVILTMGIIIIILSLIFINRMNALDHSFAREINRQKYYKSVSIQDGDTLWEIASQNMSDEYASVESYVEELKKVNDLASDQISIGQYLTVPYYVSTN